ncbi:hypothetical protein [Proteiniphilum sp. X52]|uniref:hypothetical protein n=1 Tax=Proteiniphilum sp. X52 TaxID=2382159 RepID=UPI000F0A3F79|nr:hypothetical protein [Proteiniphilum sp. X52]RNC66049.1 hypothetical protein D7D25_03650 [Proteiniphilum sp. X52]
MKTKKQSIVYLLMTFLLFYSSTSVLNAHSGSEIEASSEIQSGTPIYMRPNTTTRIGYVFYPQATKHESSIDIMVYNWDHEAVVYIEGTNIYYRFNVNGTGYCGIDISSLIKGRAYNILVDFDGVEYIGTFVK